MSPPNLFLTGLEAAERGDFARADGIARAILARDPNDVSGLQILGFSYFRRGMSVEALKVFAHANRVEPGQPALLYWLGVLYKDRGDFNAAARAFGEAVRLNPAYGEAFCHLGETFYFLGRIEDATAAFERALDCEPDSPTVLAKAARHFEQVHDLERARSLATKALDRAPENEIALIAAAEVELREKQYDAVVDLLAARLKGDPLNPRNAARLFHILATACDRLGDYPAAFAAYEKSNAITKEIGVHNITHERSPFLSGVIEQMTKTVAVADVAPRIPADELEGPTPVFLIGFVRSGTTWLDQILSSHPDAVVMEEQDNFVDAWRDFLFSDGGMSRLQHAPAAAVNEVRRNYWARANAVLGDTSQGRMVVDKAPLNTVMLSFIDRCFPDARVIFALRDPRDAVLSAFQQQFQINASMYNFLELKTAGEFYDRVMTFGALMRERSGLSFHEIRYEELVVDFEKNVRNLAEFLGLEWNDAMLAYDKTAKSRTILTPSAKQVIQRPYTSSIGKWRNYRDHMAPALPALAPWVERFGYDPD